MNWNIWLNADRLGEEKQTTKPMTNADRIRAMTDEELAEDYCEFLNATLKNVDHELDMEQAKRIMLKYLQKPAEGE